MKMSDLSPTQIGKNPVKGRRRWWINRIDHGSQKQNQTAVSPLFLALAFVGLIVIVIIKVIKSFKKKPRNKNE